MQHVHVVTMNASSKPAEVVCHWDPDRTAKARIIVAMLRLFQLKGSLVSAKALPSSVELRHGMPCLLQVSVQIAYSWR